MKNINITPKAIVIIAMLIITVGARELYAQDIVKHPVSLASTTATFYTWDYTLSPSTKKVIEYFIVVDDSGHIKTAFNACDVCYGAHKGYSQLGDKMKCNNCGNQYPVSSLGTAGTGGCWPGYIPHTLVDNEIVIRTSDLEKGEYYFLVVSGTHRDILPNVSLVQFGGELLVSMSSLASRSFHLVGINGQLYRSVDSKSDQLSLSVANLPVGMYLLHIEENGKTFSKKLFIY